MPKIRPGISADANLVVGQAHLTLTLGYLSLRGTAVLCEVDRKSLKHGDRFKIELARCLNVVLAWHPSDDMKQGRWRIVFQPLRDERRMVFDAEPW
jgi:hypothetical protein